ncbi:hypothetical protein D3C85_1611830 [compost metagenome]
MLGAVLFEPVFAQLVAALDMVGHHTAGFDQHHEVFGDITQGFPRFIVDLGFAGAALSLPAALGRLGFVDCSLTLLCHA